MATASAVSAALPTVVVAIPSVSKPQGPPVAVGVAGLVAVGGGGGVRGVLGGGGGGGGGGPGVQTAVAEVSPHGEIGRGQVRRARHEDLPVRLEGDCVADVDVAADGG